MVIRLKGSLTRKALKNTMSTAFHVTLKRYPMISRSMHVNLFDYVESYFSHIDIVKRAQA